MIASKALAPLALLAYAASAQDVPAETTERELENVEEQYERAGFDEALPDSQAFDIELDAEALLTVAYGDQVVELGEDYPADDVAALPDFWVTPLDNSTDDFSPDMQFTLMLADAAAVGGPDPEGDFRHFLANGVRFMAADGDNMTQAVDMSQATVVTQYAGPGPLENSGAHRYAWLLFQQDDEFSAPEELSSNAPADHWSVHDYVENSNLGDLVAASFFTVTADGTASFSEGSTSAAPSMMPSGSGMMSASPSAADSDQDDTEDSSAMSSGIATSVAGFAGVAALMALA